MEGFKNSGIIKAVFILIGSIAGYGLSALLLPTSAILIIVLVIAGGSLGERLASRIQGWQPRNERPWGRS